MTGILDFSFSMHTYLVGIFGFNFLPLFFCLQHSAVESAFECTVNILYYTVSVSCSLFVWSEPYWSTGYPLDLESTWIKIGFWFVDWAIIFMLLGCSAYLLLELGRMCLEQNLPNLGFQCTESLESQLSPEFCVSCTSEELMLLSFIF